MKVQIKLSSATSWSILNKLTKNREAKDAIQSIEESISGNSRVQESRKEEEVKVKTPQKVQQTAPVENKNEDQKSESKQPVKIQQAKEVKSGVNLAKDSVENWNAIVKNFNKKLIDLWNNTGADAIQGIMNKGQNYVNHFKESEINKKFEFKTKMLGIPSGNDENIRIIEGQQDDIEEADDEVNDNLEKALLEITNILYKKQYEKFWSFGSWLITYQ